MKQSLAEQLTLLADGTEHLETRADLEARLRQARPLRVKFGIDATGTELHLGHAVVLHKLRQFTELGHEVILVIGDFTTRIGDPTGRNEERPHLSEEEITHNMRTYVQQASKILDLERIRVTYNSTWLAPLNLADLIGLLSETTVARMLERNDFSKRYSTGVPIALHEFLYPVAQAYDSIALESDVELGGSEQLFNLLMGRHYQSRLGQTPQVCMTFPILEGTDGVNRMGKSRGNYVGIMESANEQFGKLMSVPDTMIPRYARLADFQSEAACAELTNGLAAGRLQPMEEKKRLAAAIVTRYHGADAARGACEHFERTVQRKETPDEMPEYRLDGAKRISEVVVAAGLAESRRAADRLIAGGGVRIDGTPATNGTAQWDASAPHVLSVGPRFVRIIPNG